MKSSGQKRCPYEIMEPGTCTEYRGEQGNCDKYDSCDKRFEFSKKKRLIENPADGSAVASVTAGLYLNYRPFAHEEFMQAMLGEKPTVQYNFTVLCIEWFLALAKVNYFDLRNEDSVMLARSISGQCGKLPHKQISSMKTERNIAVEYLNCKSMQQLMVSYLKASWESNDAFIKTLLAEHRTLQQNFSRFCIGWFQTLCKAKPGSRMAHAVLAAKVLKLDTRLSFV